MNATYSRAFEALIASEITAGNDGQVRLYEHDGRVLAYRDFAEPELADAAAQALLGADLRVVPRWAYDEDEMEVTASTALLGGTCELVSP